MPRKKSDKPKRNPWKDALYGTYEGPRGNADQWRAAFGEAMSVEQAEEILGDDSPWTILGVKIGSAFDEIKRAWRQFVSKNHPDRFHDKGEAERAAAHARYLKVKAAYVKLGGRD